ncbi:MAG: Na/Pi symporter [Bryobacterales bacterium]|nr:Na/Pi symporter [Bryobacterales bacterium]
MSTEPASDPSQQATARPVLSGIAVVLLLFVFLAAVRGLGDGFKLLGGDLLEAFFSATSNPFIALMVGLLSTTLVQSSSVTTSLVVGLVAAPENPLPLANAVPMIMGANIGTTVTNTLVSLAHMGRRDEFRSAFSVAICHDFFNYLAVLVLLPFEMATGFLARSAGSLADRLPDFGGGAFESPLTAALKVAFGPIRSLAAWLFDAPQGQGTVIILTSGVLIFGALFLIVRVLHSALQSKAESFLERSLGRSALVAMAVGCLVTAMVQSSSITTSLLVPLAGVGLITLNQAFPVTLGANLGTTITALLASLAVSGPNAQAGVEIALTHLTFNLTGIFLIYPWPPVRNLVLSCVKRFADLAADSKALAIGYLLILFYGLPALAAFLQ